MFTSLADCTTALRLYFDAKAATALAASVSPCVLFHATAERSTHLGGLPDMAPGISWPERKPPADLTARLEQWQGLDDVQRDLERIRPLSFVAQIDLAELSGLGNLAAELPDHGRLLFFMDLQLGPWEGGLDACRVIWDRAPADQTRQHPLPESLLALDAEEKARFEAEWRAASDPERIEAQLAEMAKAHRQFMPDQPFEADDIRQTLLAATLGPHVYRSMLTLPRQAIAPRLGYQLPLPGAPEFEAMDATLTQVMDEADRMDAVAAFMDETYGLPEGVLAHGLGMPLPEQDDPRFGVGDDGYDPARAREWRLLFQVSVPALLTDDQGKGEFYLLIRRDALAQRNFDAVHLAYQQT